MQRRKLLVPLLSIVAFAALALTYVFVAGYSPRLGLDLQGGASVVLQPNRKVDQSTLDTTIQVIRNRVDALGVAEPEITRQGSNILIELPGVKDQQRALQLVGQTAELRFRPVLQQLSISSTPTTSTTAPGATSTTVTGATSTSVGSTSTVASSTTVPATGGVGSARGVREPAAASTTTVAPSSTTVTPTTGASTTVAPSTTVLGPTTPTTGVTIPTATTVAPTQTTPREQDDPTQDVVLDQLDSKGQVVARYLLGPSQFTGSVISSAASALDNSSQWSVQLALKGGANGIDKWNALAAECYSGAATCPATGLGDQNAPRGRIAIVLDSVVKSAPVVNAPTFAADQISITGAFSQGQANDLALVLKYGALPVQLTPQAVETVSATLGKDSLRAGIVAGLVGLALVMLLMLVYYRSLGLVVMGGLTVSAALLWAVVSFLGHRWSLALTLAGATGIIVSIGVTVDSYVVFFERLKDDVHAGKSLRTSAPRGFKSAYRTIIAADSVSLMGAAVLYFFTVGSVRGFAFFLGLSTILDMITAWLFTRPLVLILSRRENFNRGHVLGLEVGPVPGGVQ